MSTINQLSTADVISDGDLLALYTTNNGDARKASISLLKTYMQDNLTFSQSAFKTQYSSPLTGASVTIAPATSNTHLIITPSSTISALTLVMPVVPGAVDKQEVLVNSTQIITTLTITANGATAVLGAPTTLATTNEFFRLKYDALMKTWYRVG